MDGSLTGTAGAVVTKRGVYFADTDANCSDKSGWNMQVCGGRYVKVSKSLWGCLCNRWQQQQGLDYRVTIQLVQNLLLT